MSSIDIDSNVKWINFEELEKYIRYTCPYYANFSNIVECKYHFDDIKRKTIIEYC